MTTTAYSFLQSWRGITLVFIITNLGMSFRHVPDKVDHQECCYHYCDEESNWSYSDYRFFNGYRWWMVCAPTYFLLYQNKNCIFSIIGILVYMTSLIGAGVTIDILRPEYCRNPHNLPIDIVREDMPYEFFLLVLPAALLVGISLLELKNLWCPGQVPDSEYTEV